MTDNDGRNYQILNTIATGGTAVLYKAIQTSLDRHVVVKRLHSHLISDPNFTKRFELEAKAAASLDHENIVRIIDFGSSHDNYYIVMEYIDGMSLKEIMTDHGAFDQELALLVTREICIGLDHAHQRGIVHRDIKPANIMVTNDGQVKITDFGLAKLHQSQTQQTVANTLLGTPLYMSPEQAIGDNVDGRSDLFSLGTMCYEMITGTQPFLGDNYAVVIQNIIHGSIPPPSRLRKSIDHEIESIVMKALCKEPGRRFRTAIEMARAIETALGQEKIASAKTKLRRLMNGAGACDPVSEPAPRPGRKRVRRILPALVTAAAAAAAALIMILNPGSIDTTWMHINALFSPNPAAPLPEHRMAGHSDMLGPAGFIAVPIQQDPDSTPKEPSPGALMDSTLGVKMPAGPPAEMPFIPAGDEPVEAPATDVPAGDPESPAIERTQPAAPAVGYIDIIVEPEATIYIDGEQHSRATHIGPVELTVGQHEILCEREGYREYNESISIKKNEMSKRRILLQTVTGSVHFDTEPGVMIYVNGTYKGLTPMGRPLDLPSGSCRIELKKAGYTSWSSEVYIPADEVVWLSIKLTPQ
jgi:tRNA A-37 threonylcarbamoyl transferase component Bud32